MRHSAMPRPYRPQMVKLIADIGATNARFALVDNGAIGHIRVLPCADYPTLAEAACAYLDLEKAAAESGAFAVATALDGTDRVEMTNHAWKFSIEDTRAAIGLAQLRVINDFEALAHAVPYLQATDYYQLGGVAPRKGLPIGIIGPGTGLGVAAVFFSEGKPVPSPAEGGHVTMPAMNAREFALFEYLKKTKYHHISGERVCSGKGLVNLYQAVCGVDGLCLPERAPAEITAAALAGACAVCSEVVDLFCHFLGVLAGNLALTLGAGGGIYIAGGIVPQLGENYFRVSRFRTSFQDKGRFSDYVARIPTFVITHPYPGFEGLVRI